MNTQFIGANIQGYQVATRVRTAKHWLVRAGRNVIGPVSIELLERGLEAGKIPSDAEMALLGGNEWRQVTEIFPAPPPEASEAPAEPVTVAPIIELAPAVQPQVQAPPSEPPPATALTPAYPATQPQAYPGQPTFAPFPVPPATPSGHFLDDPINIPKQGMLSALFS